MKTRSNLKTSAEESYVFVDILFFGLISALSSFAWSLKTDSMWKFQLWNWSVCINDNHICTWMLWGVRLHSIPQLLDLLNGLICNELLIKGNIHVRLQISMINYILNYPTNYDDQIPLLKQLENKKITVFFCQNELCIKKKKNKLSIWAD